MATFFNSYCLSKMVLKSLAAAMLAVSCAFFPARAGAKESQSYSSALWQKLSRAAESRAVEEEQLPRRYLAPHENQRSFDIYLDFDEKVERGFRLRFDGIAPILESKSQPVGYNFLTNEFRIGSISNAKDFLNELEKEGNWKAIELGGKPLSYYEGELNKLANQLGSEIEEFGSFLGNRLGGYSESFKDWISAKMAPVLLAIAADGSISEQEWELLRDSAYAAAEEYYNTKLSEADRAEISAHWEKFKSTANDALNSTDIDDILLAALEDKNAFMEFLQSINYKGHPLFNDSLAVFNTLKEQADGWEESDNRFYTRGESSTDLRNMSELYLREILDGNVWLDFGLVLEDWAKINSNFEAETVYKASYPDIYGIAFARAGYNLDAELEHSVAVQLNSPISRRARLGYGFNVRNFERTTEAATTSAELRIDGTGNMSGSYSVESISGKADGTALLNHVSYADSEQLWLGFVDLGFELELKRLRERTSKNTGSLKLDLAAALKEEDFYSFSSEHAKSKTERNLRLLKPAAAVLFGLKLTEALEHEQLIAARAIKLWPYAGAVNWREKSFFGGMLLGYGSLFAGRAKLEWASPPSFELLYNIFGESEESELIDYFSEKETVLASLFPARHAKADDLKRRFFYSLERLLAIGYASENHTQRFSLAWSGWPARSAVTEIGYLSGDNMHGGIFSIGVPQLMVSGHLSVGGTREQKSLSYGGSFSAQIWPALHASVQAYRTTFPIYAYYAGIALTAFL